MLLGLLEVIKTSRVKDYFDLIITGDLIDVILRLNL